jgi:glyoxylase-like metal-dependent hydrolase (beta-lactamase superfamily II)
VSKLAVYFLDVGQGDCSLIVPPDEAPLLMDCADAYVAERFITDAGLERLSAVVVSHLDEDHSGGMLTFLEAFLAGGGQVGVLYIGLDRPPGKLQDGPKRELLERALHWRKEGRLQLARPLREAQPQVLLRGGDWRVRIVLPFYADVLHRAGVPR